MKPETAVIAVAGWNIHTEHYRSPQADKTLLLVNGSLATTASFAQTLRYLYPRFNVVLYDAPYAGRSKACNVSGVCLGKEREADILAGLIDHVRADHLMAFSWGGIAALMALARRPRTVTRAVIASFAPTFNDAMLDYLTRGLEHLRQGDRERVAGLVNATIGQHLSALYKRHNHRHIASLDLHEYRQMHAHIQQMLDLESRDYCDAFTAIDIPLLFVNGERDAYTPPADARRFAAYIDDSHFATIDNAGHFLDMEHKRAWEATRDAVLGFLDTSAPARRRLVDTCGALALAG
ncbi:alpha/beta fold hydrolase [Pseudomonas mangiferae]|uniref:Alpha/beta hydrolase n=1 Tax=Pseudomonas mangiferae TaxID=2593654 RepID=A0A553H2C4_9PSED|nr:alpha/beta hydrolase [Pseudomonas mangiferae]TRX75907.1 alpha/beta hydrolase [Pseudomonas mangiferae]